MSKRKYCCAVKSCSTKNDGRISFFRFPKDRYCEVSFDVKISSVEFMILFCRCREWLKLCSREELSDKPDDYYYNNLRVCAKHFRDSMFLNDMHNRLHQHAQPQLYIANIIGDTINSPIPTCSKSTLPIVLDEIELNINVER